MCQRKTPQKRTLGSPLISASCNLKSGRLQYYQLHPISWNRHVVKLTCSTLNHSAINGHTEPHKAIGCSHTAT